MQCKFRVLNQDPIRDYKESCKITQGIDLSDREIKAPENEVDYWIKQIVANHSTIRSVKFRMYAQAPKSVVMQIIRATKGHPQPYVQSSRPDWVGEERSGDPYEEKMFIVDYTAESWVELCKQRLCTRTETRTRDFVRFCVNSLIHAKAPFLEAVGWCSNPACWWLKGCPELKTCGFMGNKESPSDIIIACKNRYYEDIKPKMEEMNGNRS